MSVLSTLCQSYVAEAANALGVNPRTLARWSEDGKIKTITTEAGQRRYDIAEYLKQKSGTTELARRSTVLYARVSTSSQRDDLKRQTEALTTSYPGGEIITEIGSGLIECLCEKFDCKLVVLYQQKYSPQAELVQDMLSVVYCFSSRLYGLRKYEKQLREDSEIQKQKTTLTEIDSEVSAELCEKNLGLS